MAKKSEIIVERVYASPNGPEIQKHKVVYLPMEYDPKKVREGLLEILRLVKAHETTETGESKVV